MNELTEFTGPSEALGRRYGAQGPMGGLVRTIATDLFPVVQVGSELADPEQAYLGGETLVVGTIVDAAPGVGLSARAGLMNPAASGVLIVVIALRVFEESAAGIGTYDVRMVPDGVSAGPDSTAQGRPRDSRFGPAQSSGVLFTLSSATTSGERMEMLRVPIFLTGDAIGCPYVLAPASQLVVHHTTENVALRIVVQWRERRIGQWERRSG